MIFNIRKRLYQCKFYRTALSLKCYAGRITTSERGANKNYREMKCPPHATCMKRWSRHGDGTVEISKYCYPKSRLDKLGMKPDECVQNTADNTVCICSTDLCNSISNLNHWVTSILVTLCILFVI